MRLFLKVIGFLMLGFLFIALILYINGVTHVDFDTRYYSFLLDVNKKLSDWSVISIPKIPDAPQYGPADIEGDTIRAFINGFMQFVNIIISFFNFIIMFINELITIVKFVVALVVVLFEDLPAIFKPSVQDTPVVDSLILL